MNWQGTLTQAFTRFLEYINCEYLQKYRRAAISIKWTVDKMIQMTISYKNKILFDSHVIVYYVKCGKLHTPARKQKVILGFQNTAMQVNKAPSQAPT